MRPAFSLIVFTTLSGAGLGLAFVMGVAASLREGSLAPPSSLWWGLEATPSLLWWLIGTALAMGLMGAGVLASTFHLGHPERAWRALSQWRTSWLSREGVLAGLTMLVMLAWAADGIAHGQPRPWLGLVVSGLGVATVWATAMIYASLKTVARWHHPLTPVLFLSYGFCGGLILAATLEILAMGGMGSMGGGIGGGMGFMGGVFIAPALGGLIITGLIGFVWSRRAGAGGSGSSPESATGLGGFGTVRMLMPPHSEENWLQHEMGFKIARKHAVRLRRIGVLMAIIIPAVLMILAAQIAPGGALADSVVSAGGVENSGNLTAGGLMAGVVMILASLIHLMGVMVSRWLFFAEAKHTMSLYYGERH